MKSRPFLPAIIYGLLLFILFSLPVNELDKIQSLNKFFRLIFSDYSMHFFAFGIFTALLCYGFLKRNPLSVPCFKVGLISISFGLFIEAYQGFLSYRSSSIKDLFSNMVGIFVTLILVKIYIALRKS
jgi:VanZ family protein